jgi:hypothetical protein
MNIHMKLISLLILLFVSITANCQLQKSDPSTDWKLIGEAKSGGAFVAKLEYSIHNGDTLYLLQFKNLQYQHINDIQSIEFKAEFGILDTLYSLLKSAIDAEKMSKISFKLGEENIEVVTRKHAGFTGINFVMLRNGANFGLTRKMLDRLFAKKE